MMQNLHLKLIHWADSMADRIIRQYGDRESYTVATGITPSGVTHFGNFRETITVDLVARALRDRGKNARMIFSSDDYDTFRKIPKNMPNQDQLEKFLFMPIVDTPAPYGKEESYARYHQKNYERQLDRMGIHPEMIYQAKKYRNGDYTEGIKTALKNRNQIIEILNKHRTSPLDDDWMPVSIYCSSCNRDHDITNIKYDGDDTLTYSCNHCKNEGHLSISSGDGVKLPWRIDWPMRWAYESVDFEPGGKDHSSEGGSFSTAKDIIKIYGREAPSYLQYDFVSVKGAGGKMSSSTGELITVDDVLNVYEPEMLRWIFASYKTNVDFQVSFDLDVIKLYEDFDRTERLAFGIDQGNEKKQMMAQRVYELSQIENMPEIIPIQPSFRHLCNILQICNLDINRAKTFYQKDIKNDRDERRYNERASCAFFWLNNYAPEEFKFSLNKKMPTNLKLTELQKLFLKKIIDLIKSDKFDALKTDKELHGQLYTIIKTIDGLEPKDAFLCMYQILISQDKGPKLASFLRTIGKNRSLECLEYRE